MMMRNKELLEYALKVQRLHQIMVLKDDIHLTYKYKNINRAKKQAETFQDKIINNLIEDAVYGTSSEIKSKTIDKTVEDIIDTNLRNDTKRFNRNIPAKESNAGVTNISNRYQWILSNRIKEEIPKLQDKIDAEINKNSNLTTTELLDHLHEKLGDHAQARIKNIIQDSFHTNECNQSWINAVNNGYKYKIWMNGRSKGKTRAWHISSYIASVPVDETFDIYGSYPAHVMYPGDLNGGAENVANCRCWLQYTNQKPSDLSSSSKKTSSKSSKKSSKKKSNGSGGWGSRIKATLKKPVDKVKSVTKTVKNKIKSKISKPKTNTKSTKSNLINNPHKSKGNKQITIDTEIYSEEIFEFDEHKVKQKLREELPNDISNEAIDYIIKVLMKKGTAKFEYGQIFNYKTGTPESIEFGGYSDRAVVIEEKGSYKNTSLMTDEEYKNYYKNPEKYTVNYVENKDCLSIQHNHTSIGLTPPSTSDFLDIIGKDWADYSFCISTKKIWVIEYKDQYSLPLCRDIEEDILPIEKEAKSMGGKKSKEDIDIWYGNKIEEYINNHENNINIYKVIL